MRVQLTYCSMWGYEDRAVSLTEKVLTHFKQDVQEMTLIPAGGGVFELVVDGKLLYSKKKTGEFPDEQWVLDAMSGKSAKALA